jgi:acyl dehydratase
MPLIELEDLDKYVGKAVGNSDWLLIDQNRINQFADVTIDHQFIHVDTERAKNGPFSSTIAHGFLTLSLLPHFSYADASISIKHTSTRINYGLNRLRFINPVKVDSEIRAHFTFIEYTEKNPGHILLTHEVSIEIKNETKPAMIAEVLTLCILDQ